MGKDNPEELNNLLNEIDSFLQEFDEVQPSPKDGEETIGNPAKRERLIRELFQDTEPSLNGTVELQVSDDEMKVSIDCYPPQGEGEPIRIEEVEKQLEDAEISHGVDWNVIQDTLFTCNTERKHMSGVLIAQGVAPSPEIPEHLLLKKSLLSHKREKPKSSRTQIDYRKDSPFTIVEGGEVLAKLRRKKEGTHGCTVKGKTLPYRSAKITQLTPGENTEWVGDTVVASCYGRFLHGGTTFGIKEVLEITTDVDYHTGNIDFPGDIIIYGEVKDRFTVHSGGSVYCSSTLDAFDVSCEGDLLVTGGIIGRREGVVKAGGKIRTNFIENCYVEAEDTIFVKTGVMNSIVNTKGKLTMGTRGIIIGGKVFAQNGVEAAQIGTHSQTRTEINCGIDFSIQQKLFWIKENHLKLVEKKHKIELLISKHTDTHDALVQLKEDISGKIRKLSEASILLLDRLDKNESAYVAVSDTIHSGVYIEICHTSFVVTKPMSKVKFSLNKNTGKIIVNT